jgi:ribosomal protein S18 acetylase RimI-like enzyme
MERDRVYNMKIRAFDMSDYPAVKGIWENVFTLRPTDDKSYIKLKLQRDPDLFLVAEVDDEVVGVVFASYDGRQAIIHRLAVMPEYQKKGIGSELMSKLMGRLEQMGEIRIAVHASEEYVIRFFKRFGLGESDVTYLKKDNWS